MPGSVIELLDRFPEAIARTIDLTLEMPSATGGRYQLGLPDPAITRYIPVNRYPATKLAWQKIQERKPTIAFIVGTDGEYPIRREAVQMSLEMVGSAKLARARLFTEEDFDLLHEAEMYLASNNPQVYNLFVERYMQTPAYLTQAIQILAMVLAIEVLHSGVCTYVDPETRLGFELSYLNSVPATNRPADLTGGALWSAATTATPLTNLKDHLNAYYANLYAFPPAIAMSSAAAEAMLNANDTKNKIARMRGSITSEADFTAGALANIARPTIEEVRQWLANELTLTAQGATAVPEFIISDGGYYKYNSDGTVATSATRFFPVGKYFFLGEGWIEGAYVPTATNNYAAAFAFVTELLSKAPKREKAAIDTRYMVLCPDARRLGWRTVL